jgi:hypothetical protein
MAAKRSRASPEPSSDPSVAKCGKHDTTLAAGNGLIPAKTDHTNGLLHDPLKPAQGQGSSVETTSGPFSRPHT